MTENEAYAVLSNVSWFKDGGGGAANERLLRYLAGRVYCFRYTKNHFIMSQGDACKGMYVTVRGNIKLFTLSPEGKEHVLRIVTPGQTFAEALVFNKKASPVTVQTLTDAKVLLIPSETIQQCIREYPVCASNIIASLSNQIYMMVKTMNSITLNSSEHRVIGFLLQDLLANYNDSDEGQVTLETSKLDIASCLNIAPETFSRVLHKFSEQGLISVNNKVIHVHSIKKLRSL